MFTFMAHSCKKGYPANMFTLGQRRETVALERQRRRRVTTLAQRDGWRRHRTTLSHRRVMMLAQHCSDDGWRRHRTTLSHRPVAMLAQRCSDDGWRRRRNNAKPTSSPFVGMAKTIYAISHCRCK